MSPLGFKSVVYHGELRLGELNAIPVKEGFRFPNDEIRIHRLSPPGERCPPLAVLQTISPFAVRCKLESFSPVKPTELTHLHATCFHESKTASVLLGDEEIHLVAMPSKEKKFPCFWCFSVPAGLYHSCLRMLNMRCLSIVFDLDETLIVANTMKSFEDRIEALRAWIAQETDPIRIEGMSGELKRYLDDRMLLKQYIENDYVFDNGVMLKVQHEEVSPLSDSHERVIRPVIRLQDKNLVLTRINPEVRDTSVLVRLRPAWDDLRSYLTAKGRKRFEVYVCTMAEREYALEIWRLLDPEAELISSKQLLERVVCVKSGSRKSLLNVFHDGICHPKMAMVIDDRSKVWEDQDQPRVHVVPAYSPYHLPQAETVNPIPILCIARNVACNVRAYFFKEFDENLIRNISLVSYEDEVGNLPPTPDVSNYLSMEDTGYVMNGKIGAPFRDGMSGGEVEQRLNQTDEKAAADSSLLPAASSSEVKPETPKPQAATFPSVLGCTSTSASMFSNKPSLLGVPRRENQFSDAGRPLVVKPGFDSRILNSGQPALLSRFPVQTPPFSVHPQGGWLAEEQSSRSLLGRPSGVNQNPFSSNGTGSAVAAPISHGFAPQPRSEELRVSEDPKRQNFPLVQPGDASLPQNNSNHVSSNGKEHQTESGNHNGLPSHLFVSVLQEIGRRCGSKVEFRSVLSTNKDSQFSVEVLYAGEKIGVGLGRTRKDAYQQAAENGLHSLADKYLAYIAPLAVAADREQRHENGFLWDTPNSVSNEGSIVDESPSESAPEKNQDAGSL